MLLIISLFIHISVLSLFVLSMNECAILHKNESLSYEKEVSRRNAKPENAFTSLPNTLKDNLYYSTLLYSIEHLFKDQYEPQKRPKNHKKSGKFKNLNPSKKSKQEDEVKVAKHLTEKLFQLFRKLDLGVNNNLITELKHLKEKFNIVDTSDDEISRHGTNYEKPWNLPTDKNETKEPPFSEDTNDQITQTPELITMEQNEYSIDEDAETAEEYGSDSDSTTVNSANEADSYNTTIQNYDEEDNNYDGEIGFRQKDKTDDEKDKGKQKDKEAKKKEGKEHNTNKAEKKEKDKKQEKLSKQNGKGKPKNENKMEVEEKDKKEKEVKKRDKEEEKTKRKDEKREIDEKPQRDKTLPDENSTTTEKVTRPIKQRITKPATETSTIPSNNNEEDDDDVITIRRVRGIWLGGHCRCNYFIRSSANNISAKPAISIILYLFLKLTKYL